MADECCLVLVGVCFLFACRSIELDGACVGAASCASAIRYSSRAVARTHFIIVQVLRLCIHSRRGVLQCVRRYGTGEKRHVVC